MSAERPNVIDLKKSFISWAGVTLVAAGVSVYGIQGFISQTEKPINLECSTAKKAVSDLQGQLLTDGVLGIDDKIFFPDLEVRNPDDPRLKALGQLKNDRDKKCFAAQSEYEKSFDMWAVISALGGGVTAFLGIQQMARIYRRHLLIK